MPRNGRQPSGPTRRVTRCGACLGYGHRHAALIQTAAQDPFDKARELLRNSLDKADAKTVAAVTTLPPARVRIRSDRGHQRGGPILPVRYRRQRQVGVYSHHHRNSGSAASSRPAHSSARPRASLPTRSLSQTPEQQSAASLATTLQRQAVHPPFRCSTSYGATHRKEAAACGMS
jgi:hypothetical protein